MLTVKRLRRRSACVFAQSGQRLWKEFYIQTFKVLAICSRCSLEESFEYNKDAIPANRISRGGLTLYNDQRSYLIPCTRSATAWTQTRPDDMVWSVSKLFDTLMICQKGFETMDFLTKQKRIFKQNKNSK